MTLLEVLVVIGIVGVLAALLLAAVQQAREAAGRAACQNNLHQLSLAVANYESARGEMPPYATGLPGTPYANWFMYAAPFLEQGKAANGATGYPVVPKTAVNTILVPTSVAENVKFKVLRCPSDPGQSLESYWGKTSYEANWYAFGDGESGWFPPPQRLANLTSGLSNVVLFAEAYAYCDRMPRMALATPWYHTFGVTQQALPSDDPVYLPKDYTMFQVRPRPGGGPGGCDRLRTQTPHQAMNAALGDGSVRGVSGAIAPAVWKRVLQPRSTAPIPSDW